MNTTGKPGPKIKRKDRKDYRRTQIIEAAIRTLGDLGWEQTTIEAIANEAGVSRGLITFYFDTKDTLLVQTFDHMCRRFEAEFAEAPRGKGSAWDRLIAVLECHFSKAIWDRKRISVWQVFRAQAQANEELKNRVQQMDEAYLADLTTYISEAARERGRVNFDSIHVALTAFALIEGMRSDFITTPTRFARATARSLVLQFAKDVLG
jgi:AcrR family transcriptional regulator